MTWKPGMNAQFVYSNLKREKVYKEIYKCKKCIFYDRNINKCTQNNCTV